MMTWLSLLLVLTMQPAPSSVQIIARDAMSNVEDAKQAVARTPAEFTALWRQHAGGSAAPQVDFASRMVVAVFLGTRTSAGYSVEVTGTRQVDGTLIVAWQERKPGRDAVSAQVITSPAVFASIPKFQGDVTFEKVEK